MPLRTYTMVLEGPQSVRAAEEIRKDKERRHEWPYPYTYPPPGAIRVTAGADPSGTLVSPIPPAVSQAVVYTVDQGFYFALQALVVIFIGSGSPPVPGDFTWSLTVNQPVGSAAFQGYSEQGLTNVDVPLGTLQIPWPLERPEIYKANDTLRIVITNVNLATGVGNYFKTILLGWRWPMG